jgi:multidrug efflux pump subunit AcrA (membrane-fusion protein)
MYVRVLIHSRQESTGLLVPVSAICATTRTCRLSMSPSPTAAFARRHVTLGYRTGDQYDIPDGLKAGDQIVVDGGSSFNSCKTNERPSAPTRNPRRERLDHEPRSWPRRCGSAFSSSC